MMHGSMNIKFTYEIICTQIVVAVISVNNLTKFFFAQQPKSGLHRLWFQVSTSHTIRHTYTTLGWTPLHE